MDSELRSQTARYVQLLRRSGQKDTWLPAGLTRRLPASSDRAAVAQPLRARAEAISSPPSSISHLSSSNPSSPHSSAAAPKSNLNLNLNLNDGSKADRLGELKKKTVVCTLCPHLAKSRTQVVFGVGNPEAKLMFVGEAPGADEDEKGEPFVGRAGQLLTKMLTAMELTREQIYIANVLKCRPDTPPNTSGNRKPTRDEMDACLPYLRAQVAVIAPQVIVALGATAVEGLFGPQKMNMTRLRGNWRELDGVPVRLTFHPSYLLHNQDIALKRLVWEDLLAVMERLAMPISEKQRGFFLKS